MITFLKVRNFKSLENVALSLGPLHVLVGPNNSGKSNLFDVFRFLRELAEIGEQAVHSRGGFSQIVWGGDIKRTISFELHSLTGNDKARKEKVIYQLEIGGSPLYFSILKERLSVFNEQERDKPLLAFPSDGNKASLTDVNGQKWELSQPPNRSLIERIRDQTSYEPLTRFADDLYRWSCYNFEPSAMRKPNAVRQDFRVEATGQNFSSVMHSIQSEHVVRFGEIENLLKTALPEVRHVLTALTKDGQTYVSLEEQSMPMRVPAWAMSDGTLRLLAQLAALYSPAPPSLACYEEPENYLHPGWLSLIADVLKNAASKAQVLISTHSPYLLNFFSPEHLIIVEKEKGRSQFKAVTKKKGLKESLRVLGLGEIWYSGELGGIP